MKKFILTSLLVLFISVVYAKDVPESVEMKFQPEAYGSLQEDGWKCTAIGGNRSSKPVLALHENRVEFRNTIYNTPKIKSGMELVWRWRVGDTTNIAHLQPNNQLAIYTYSETGTFMPPIVNLNCYEHRFKFRKLSVQECKDLGLGNCK